MAPKKTTCEKCKADCCHNLAIPTTRPRNRSEIDYLKWHLQYDTVRVFIQSRRWYILVEGKCMYLSKNHLCTIYDRRPAICRDHASENCEATGKWYDVMISTPDELEAYLKHKKKPSQRKAA